MWRSSGPGMGFLELFRQNVLVQWLTGRPGAHDLTVTMSGVRLGERFLQIGLGDGALLVALAAKTGLSGRACGIDEDQDTLNAARRTAERSGVLAELERAVPPTLPFDAGNFDLVVVNAVSLRPLASWGTPFFGEVIRVLRPGGRCVVVTKGAQGGLGHHAAPGAPASAGILEDMRGAGFRAPRLLAEREGLAFAEAVRSAS
jgi:SAM-dependent methyltransferase